jgi:hypothetical protein
MVPTRRQADAVQGWAGIGEYEMAAGYRDTRKNSPSGRRAPSRWESPIRVKKKKTFPRKGSALDVADRETLMKIGQKKKKSDKIKTRKTPKANVNSAANKRSQAVGRARVRAKQAAELKSNRDARRLKRMMGGDPTGSKPTGMEAERAFRYKYRMKNKKIPKGK